MGTPRRTTSPHRCVALHLGRLLTVSSAVSVALLTQAGAADASTSSFAPYILTHMGNAPLSVAVDDFNSDNILDVVTAGNTINVAFGEGDGNFDRGPVYDVGASYAASVAVGDFDADGNPDLVATAGDNQVWVLLGTPDGTFGEATAFGAGENPSSVVVGDLNHDDDLDLAVANTIPGGSTVSVLLGGPGGTFGAATAYAAGSHPSSVVIGDFDESSDPDLAVSNGGTVSVLLGAGDGSFGPPSSLEIGGDAANFTAIAAGNLNGDSDPDLAVFADQVGIVILLGGAGETFAPGQTVAPTGAYDTRRVMGIGVGDFNSDSRADLVLASPDDGLAVVHGDGHGAFSGLRAFSTHGSPVAVAVGNVDGDQLPDLVAANYSSADSPGGDVAALLNTLDSTPPNTTIASGPDGPTSDATPTFTFGSSETGLTFECRLDGGSFSACTSPQTLPALDDGTHTFEVRATDRSANVDPTPASRTFTVDTVAPETTITGGPDGPTNDNAPTFTFVASEPGATFECSIAGFFLPCTSPYQPGHLGDGDFDFQVRARDAAGNLDATPASRSFTIDRSPPTTSITSGPSGATGDSTPTFGFQSPEPGATFECRVDDGAFEACTTPHTTAELADGDHVFYVRSIDPVGNVDPIPAAIAFTVDTVAPDTTLSGPTGTIYDRTPSFSFSSSGDAMSHECRVDDEPFTACTSPTTAEPLSDGEHTYEVRATDFAGNVDPTPAHLAFTVDTEIFRTGITAGPTGLTDDATPTFSFGTPDPNSTFECRVAPAPFEDCASPYTTSQQSDGEHTFEVRATDSYGNVEPHPASRSFTVDTVAPDTTMVSGPTGTIADQTPTFGFTSSDAGATFECRLDGAPFGPCTTPYTTAPLDNGNHTFQARAIDAAGNADATPASRAFTVNVDTTAPKTRIDSGPGDFTNRLDAKFTFSADEPATFECKLDGAAFAPCHSGDTFGPLGAGTHAFAVRATDLAGNVDPTPAEWNWIVDTTPPQTTLTSGPTLLSLLTSRTTFVFGSSEGGSLFECQLDGGAWTACTSPRTYSGLHLGNHSFAVRATDPAGNTDPTPAKATWFTLGLPAF